MGQWSPKIKVLVANDEPMQLLVLKLLFSRLNCEVVTARNGHEAY